MSTGSVLPDLTGATALTTEQINKERMSHYKAMAVSFSYPDEKFFEYFPDLRQHDQTLMEEYDRLFRAGIVWLYGAEHLVKNEFQRARMLSDIMGFYTAFALEPDKERPDSITCEMEFMYGIIFKSDRIVQGMVSDDTKEKLEVCNDAERKFFVEHLEPAATKIAEKIVSQSQHFFYQEAAKELLSFLETEREHFGLATAKNGKE